MFTPTVQEEQLPIAAVEHDDFADVHPVLDAGERLAPAVPAPQEILRMPWTRK